MLKVLLISVLAAVRLPAAEPPTLDEALEHLYNFRFSTAQATLDRIIASRPADPLPYAFRASGYLFYELDRLGALEAEFLSTDDWAYDKRKQKPDPAVRARMEEALRDAQTRGEAALKIDANDKNALFALTIVGGIRADYMALVDKRQFGSLTPSKFSNTYAQRLLKLDPKFYDAYMTAGFSEYIVGSLPFFVKWFVHWDNVAGNKEAGKHNLELAAREGHYFRPMARIFLAIIDLREKRPRDAQKLVADLVRDYPANPLFQKELGKLNSRLAGGND